MSHFKLISETSVVDTFPIRKYVSRRTGLTVVIADVEGVNICGTFTIVTEPEDDNGHPHALEHLIFNGSENYPYHGLITTLDENASIWTEADRTEFSFSVSGQNIALALLPIYFDHILRPLLCEEGFVHYVHHVNGNGEDGGLTYEEMKEPGEYKMCIQKITKEMYPGSGYSYEYKGIAECLRDDTSIEKIREFHKKFSRPDNMVLTITGIIDSEALFTTLSDVEDDYMQKRLSDPWENWTKPWQSTPPTPNYGEHSVEWSNDLEKHAYVLIGWRGPVLTDNTARKELRCCEYLLQHLRDTDTPLLHKHLVKIDLAGCISLTVDELKFSHIRLEIFDIPIQNLETVKTETFKCIKNIREGIEDIDFDKVKEYVAKEFRNHKSSLETFTHSEISELVARDFLLSEKSDDFEYRMKLEIYNDLLEEPKEYWLNIFRKYFTDNYVLVVGKPSDDVPKLEEVDKKRAEERKAKLSEEELAEKAAIVKKAQEFVEKPIPQDILDLIPLPLVDTIAFTHVESWSSDSAPCSHFDTKDLPIFARVQSITTNLVHIHLILDTSSLHHDLRKWLPIILKCFEEYPSKSEDRNIPADDAISKLQRYAERWLCQLGFGGADVGTFGNFINVQLQCFPEDYENVVSLLHDVLYNTEITKGRLLTVIADEKDRYPNLTTYIQREFVTEQLVNNSLYSENSNMYWCTRHKYFTFLNQLKGQLETNCEDVMKIAQMACNSITERVWLNLAADFTKYRLSTEPWKKFTKGDNLHPVQVPHLYWDAELISNWGGGSIVGLETAKLPYFTLKSPGPVGHSVNEEAALLVALHYFKKKWLSKISKQSDNQVLIPSLNEGCITLWLYEVEDPAEAYSTVKTLLNDYLSGSATDAALFKASKEYVINDILSKEDYPGAVVRSSLLKYLQRTGEHYTKDLVKVISEMTPENARVAAARRLPSLFDRENTKIAVLCPPDKVLDIQAGFEKLGIRLEDKSTDVECIREMLKENL